MKKYKAQKVTRITEVATEIKCDNCFKEIWNNKANTKIEPKIFFVVNTYNSCGSDWYDFCSKKCLFDSLEKYFDEKSYGFSCEIHQTDISDFKIQS